MRLPLASSFLLLAFAAGCGNQGGLKNQPIAPIAIIGGDDTAPATSTFELDGRDSYDPNALEPNGIYEWEWALAEAPAGSAATVQADPDDARFGQLLSDLPGHYAVQLRVRDINDFTWSEPTIYGIRAIPVTGFSVTLHWTTDINDVDLHLLDQTDGGALFDIPYDCHWANLRPEWGPVGTDGDPSLNLDDVDGFGPETVELPVPTSGITYHAVVHYFSDDGFGQTEATAKGWVNGSEVFALTRTLDANQLWDLAVIDWSGPSGTATVNDTISEY